MTRMQLGLLAIAICGLGALTGRPAAAQYYIAGSLGLMAPEDNDISGPGFAGHESLDTGIFTSGALGFRFTPNWRVEGEFAYGETRASRLSGPYGSLPIYGGGANLYNFTANAYYDFHVALPVTPYLGGGIGIAHEQADGFSIADTTAPANTSNNFVWQLEAGFAYDITSRLAIVPSYRYMHINDGGMYPGMSAGDTAVHIFKVGLRYLF